MNEHKQPSGVETEVKRSRRVPAVGIVRVTRIPNFEEAGLILGDAVNDLRASLDHLVWDLVKLGTHSRLTEQAARQVQFPLSNASDDFRKDRKRRAPGIANAEWRILGEYQPYRRNDRGRALRLLRELSDGDKHRSIVPTVLLGSGFSYSIRLVNCIITRKHVHPSGRALHVGTHLLDIDIAPSPPDVPDYECYIKSGITVKPCLSGGIPLLSAMTGLRDTVFEILSRFEERVA